LESFGSSCSRTFNSIQDQQFHMLKYARGHDKLSILSKINEFLYLLKLKLKGSFNSIQDQHDVVALIGLISLILFQFYPRSTLLRWPSVTYARALSILSKINR